VVLRQPSSSSLAERNGLRIPRGRRRLGRRGGESRVDLARTAASDLRGIRAASVRRLRPRGEGQPGNRGPPAFGAPIPATRLASFARHRCPQHGRLVAPVAGAPAPRSAPFAAQRRALVICLGAEQPPPTWRLQRSPGAHLFGRQNQVVGGLAVLGGEPRGDHLRPWPWRSGRGPCRPAAEGAPPFCSPTESSAFNPVRAPAGLGLPAAAPGPGKGRPGN